MKGKIPPSLVALLANTRGSLTNWPVRMPRGIVPAVLVTLVCIASAAVGQEKLAPLLVVISVDGLRPDSVTAADAHGAKIPTLRRMMKEGAFADGVTGVVPTVTYPSHTTLMTGVWPAQHGIWANTTFDPLQKNY
jgi:predicted AlkP superfamily pyrophosphatase or phosphodiesterase